MVSFLWTANRQHSVVRSSIWKNNFRSSFLIDRTCLSCGEFIRQQRPDTKWVVHLLTNVTFYVNKLFDHPIGARVVLPVHILKNKAVVGLYTDNLCFLKCLAVHRGAPLTDVEVPAKTYYRQYLQQQDMTPADFKGVTLDELVVLEQVFSLNVYVYDL